MILRNGQNQIKILEHVTGDTDGELGYVIHDRINVGSVWAFSVPVKEV